MQTTYIENQESEARRARTLALRQEIAAALRGMIEAAKGTEYEAIVAPLAPMAEKFEEAGKP